MSRRLLPAAALLGLCALATQASAITRDEAIVRAKAYAFHPWTCTGANLTASCAGGYQSVYQPGDYLGLPYDWGGYMTLFTFDQQIASGYGAGSYPNDGVLDCTSGVDCSGFVSKAWATGHWTTSSVDQTSSAIALNNMLPGDIFNEAGYHMAMYSHTLGSGEPVLYESVFYNVHLSMPGWSWVDGYIPRRFSGITGTSAGNPVGTPTNPIVVGTLPYSDSRNTTQSSSDVLDGCGVSPNTQETGPEYIYQITVTQPGVLTAAVQDDAGVDIDVHLYTSMNTNDCIARHDSNISVPVDCGTYYVVADTYGGTTQYPGAYSLTIELSPTGGACGSGPPSYDFEGAVGDPCDQPFCNENLGASVCVSAYGEEYCSKACSSHADCGELPGCCLDFGNQEYYCVRQNSCDGGTGGGGTGAGGSGGGPSVGEGGNGAGPGGDPDPVGGGGAGAGFFGPGNQASSSGAETEEGGCHLGDAPRGNDGWLALVGLLLAFGARRRGEARQ